jgi:hypothetical protein
MTYSKARKVAQSLAAAVPALCLAVALTIVTWLLAWAGGDFGAARGLLYAAIAVAAVCLLSLAAVAAWTLGERFAQTKLRSQDVDDR